MVFNTIRLLPALPLAAVLFMLVSCSGENKPASPLETFKTYTKAIKQKDTATMKLLLSSDSIKMHEQEAKSQGVTLDEIIKRETLFSPEQKSVEFRNEKIEGNKATLQVKNSFGMWETVPFVFEDDQWKIDKKGYADRMIQDIEQKNQELEDQLNQGRQPE
jgi:hypothetical protein